jgi:hypothetical protein
MLHMMMESMQFCIHCISVTYATFLRPIFGYQNRSLCLFIDKQGKPNNKDMFAALPIWLAPMPDISHSLSKSNSLG